MLASRNVQSLLLLLTLTAAAATARDSGTRPVFKHPAVGSNSLASAAAGTPAAARLLQGRTDADVASSGTPAATQEAGTALKPAPQAEDSGQACLDMQLKLGGFCQVGIDRVATYFPRGSAELPDAEQVEGAIEALQTGGLPSKGCCAALAPIFAARCGCNPGFQAIRDAIQETYPTLTPAYLQGVNYILAMACGLQDASCA